MARARPLFADASGMPLTPPRPPLPRAGGRWPGRRCWSRPPLAGSAGSPVWGQHRPPPSTPLLELASPPFLQYRPWLAGQPAHRRVLLPTGRPRPSAGEAGRRHGWRLVVGCSPTGVAVTVPPCDSHATLGSSHSHYPPLPLPDLHSERVIPSSPPTPLVRRSYLCSSGFSRVPLPPSSASPALYS